MNSYLQALGVAATTAGKRALRLHLNENTGGCSPAVLQALQHITADQVSSYPDYTPAIAAVAARFDVPTGWVMLVNGLDEAVSLVAWAAARRSTLEPGTTSTRNPGSRDPGTFVGVVLAPAFDMYAAGIVHAGGRISHVAPRPNFAWSLDDVLAASEDATLIYLTEGGAPPLPVGRNGA
jgi:histidinol-phosphate/aromatic aminotransferase/cobyric acid decarboxylase-like protein